MINPTILTNDFLLEDEEEETEEEERSSSRSLRGNSRILGSGNTRALGGTPTRSSVEAMRSEIEHGREFDPGQSSRQAFDSKKTTLFGLLDSLALVRDVDDWTIGHAPPHDN